MTNKLNKPGQFQPGKSGNLAGRPKTDKLTSADKKMFQELFNKAVTEKNISNIVSELVGRCNNTQEIIKLLDKFSVYLVPKLSATKIDEKRVTTLKFIFAGDDQEKMKLVKPIIEKEIENGK